MWNSVVSPFARRLGLGEHLLERVAVRALFLRQPRVPAEDARLPQDADVRRVDVLVRGERDDVAVLRAVHGVGQRADAEEVGRVEERRRRRRASSRSPAATLSAIGRSAGSDSDAAATRAATRHGHSASLPEAFARRASRCARRTRSCCSARRRRRASPARSACSSRSHSGSGVCVVDRRRDHAVAHDERADDELDARPRRRACARSPTWSS